MKDQKFFALRSYIHDQCVTQKITWEQFISANYALQTIQLSFPDIKSPEIKIENGIFFFSFGKEENYLKLGINFKGLFVWRIFFSSLDSDGHLGFGKEHWDNKGNELLWIVIWADEKKKKYFDYFLEQK